MDPREIGWGGVEWIHLAQDRDRWRAVVNAVMNLQVLAARSELIMGPRLLENTGVAQSVLCLTTEWTAGVRSPAEADDFASNLCVQTGSGAHPASYTMGTGGSFPGG
jgi:hypothetical protein